MLDKYRRLHIHRLVQATMDLYRQPDSICKKCHEAESICCMFCYCPLYDSENCGGTYTILHNGLKDCSDCIKPHTPEFVEKFMMRFYKK